MIDDKEVKDIVKDFIKEIANTPKFKNYDVNIRNVNSFAKILEEDKNCSNCQALIDCKNDIPGYRMVLRIDNDNYYFPVEPCKYCIQKERRNNFKALANLLYLPQNLLEADFEHFDVTPERVKVFDYANKFVASMMKHTFMKGLILNGEFGTGKTYYLACVANELARNGIPSLLVYFPDLVREIKNQMADGRLERTIDLLKTVDVLMLDDMGSEMMSSWLRDEILGPIINYRMVEEKPIFISTNLDAKQFQNYLTETKDNISDSTKGARIISRLETLVKKGSVGTKSYR